jgi:SRSO17 transposase
MTGEQIASLEPKLLELLGRFRPHFKRENTFGYWRAYLTGLLSDIKRKSIEPIALTVGVPVRTLQEFLANFHWDHDRTNEAFQRLVANEHNSPAGIGVIDASGHPKQGSKTPGVQRQYCGESGKNDNCVVGQHLLYTDNDPANPFSCVLASGLYLPKSWAEDRQRCRQAGIPDDLVFRTKWQIALGQVEQAIGNGVRFSYLVFDDDYARIPKFWFGLDRLGQWGIGDVPSDFRCWVTPPACLSPRKEHAAKPVRSLAENSPVFREQSWRKVKVKDTTRGRSIWQYKAARVQLVAQPRDQRRRLSIPTDRRYWLIVAENLKTGERKHFISNAPANANVENLLRVAMARWYVEKWFERAKQEVGFGAFEVRTYTSLARHWLSSRIAMLFLAVQTQRLRGEKPEDHGRTSSGRDQRGRCETLGNVAPLVCGPDPKLRLLPVAQ